MRTSLVHSASAAMPNDTLNNMRPSCRSTDFANGAVQLARRAISLLLIGCMVPFGAADAYAQKEPPTSRPQYHQISYADLDQLVAPIALYPDALVAQILAAATYAPQIVEAHRFVQHSAAVSPQELARMVDLQPWDPSVKALSAFPSVLANLDRNLDWTNKLGNAYYNQPQDVMNAVQVMRQRAHAAGTLKSSPQEVVVYRPGAITIQPINPAVVYVPVYNPWVVYGAPIPVYPAYYYQTPVPPTGAVVTAAIVGFAAGVVVGAFASYGWGCTHWGPSSSTNTIVFNHATYISHSVTVVNHGYFGSFDHSSLARAYNQRIAYGPRGGTYTDQGSFANGQYTNTRMAMGPHGANYTDQRTIASGQYNNTRTANTFSSSTSRYPGGNSATVTGPKGNSSTRTVTGRGTGEARITRSGPNGTKTRTRHSLSHRQE